MKKIFNNRPWKEWPTRKISFTAVSLIWLIYAIIGMFGIDTNETITTTIVFNGGKWILGFGILLVISDKAADKLIVIFRKDKDTFDEEEEYGE